MKSRWGSYAPSGRLTLNFELIKAPIECIDYVIAHELCHAVYPHTFDPLLLNDVPTMKRMLESAIENHKGWSFPFPRDSLKEKDLVDCVY